MIRHIATIPSAVPSRVPGQVPSIVPGSATASAATPLLLDTYTGAVAAYSLRKLRTAYEGNCIRVRESGGDTEADIGFSGNTLDTAALSSHVGANNGFTPTAYDQGENGDNATQATSSKQHQVVVSGSTGTINGIPCFLGTGNGLQHLTDFGLTGGTEYYAVYVLSTTDTSFVLWPANGGGRYCGVATDGDVANPISSNMGTVSWRKNGAVISPSTRDDMHTQYATGSPALVGITFTPDLSADYDWGYDASAPYTTDTKFSDFIIWEADGLDKDGIDAAIMSAYGIS